MMSNHKHLGVWATASVNTHTMVRGGRLAASLTWWEGGGGGGRDTSLTYIHMTCVGWCLQKKDLHLHCTCFEVPQINIPLEAFSLFFYPFMSNILLEIRTGIEPCKYMHR